MAVPPRVRKLLQRIDILEHENRQLRSKLEGMEVVELEEKDHVVLAEELTDRITDYPLLDLSLSLPLPESDKPVVRVLTVREIADFVAPVFERNGAVLPHPANSFFVGAIRAGKVVGWITVQSVLHVEPMYVSEGESALLPRIIHTAQQEIERTLGQCKVYLTADDERIIQLAERMGMQRTGTALTKWVGALENGGEPDELQPQ